MLHSLKKSTSLPRREQWRWPLEVTSIRPTCNWRKAATKERVSYKTTANQLRRNRKKNQQLVEPLVFIATSRQSHIVRNDVTSEGHSKLKAHNAVFGNLWRTITIVTVGFSKVRERSGTEHVVAFWLATLS